VGQTFPKRGGGNRKKYVREPKKGDLRDEPPSPRKARKRIKKMRWAGKWPELRKEKTTKGGKKSLDGGGMNRKKEKGMAINRGKKKEEEIEEANRAGRTRPPS